MFGVTASGSFCKKLGGTGGKKKRITASISQGTGDTKKSHEWIPGSLRPRKSVSHEGGGGFQVRGEQCAMCRVAVAPAKNNLSTKGQTNAMCQKSQNENSRVPACFGGKHQGWGSLAGKIECGMEGRTIEKQCTGGV